MHFRAITRIVGLLVILFSGTMILPGLVALIYRDGAGRAFTQTFFVALAIGSLLWWPNRRQKGELKSREGFLIVVLFWTVLGSVGSLPFIFSEQPNLSITDAFFESFSGLTTTGATTLVGLDSLPHAILFYRQMLQWFGGMGIIVLAVAILPILGVGGMQLYRAEMPGPLKDNKMRPRIAETAKTLWLIYVLLTVACALALWFAGMPAFDAIGHSFATIAIGGFSTHDASVGYFDSPTRSGISHVHRRAVDAGGCLYAGAVDTQYLRFSAHDHQPGLFPGGIDGDDCRIYHGQYCPLAAVPAGAVAVFCFYRRLCRVDGGGLEGDSYPAAV